MKINRKFGLLFITLIIFSCSNNTPKEVGQENSVVIKDTLETKPIKIEIPIVLPDTVFYVNGKTEIINGLKCYIQYEVKGDSGAHDLKQGVQILRMALKTPSQNIPIEYMRLYKTDKYSLQKLKSVFALIGGGLLEDVNKDGYDDIKV